MSDIRTLLRALGSLLGSDTSAPLQWSYEIARSQGIILLRPPPPQLSSGRYHLADVLWGLKSVGKFGLRETELPQHVAIFGRTGAGKTNCAFIFLL